MAENLLITVYAEEWAKVKGKLLYSLRLKRHISVGDLLYYNKQKSDTLSNRANVQFAGQLIGYRSDTILRKT